MSEEKVLTLRGKKAVWAPGGGSGPIDPKRLPEGYPYKEQSETVIAEKQTVVFEPFNGNMAGMLEGYTGPLVIGKTYKIVFDGTEFMSTAETVELGVGIGNETVTILAMDDMAMVVVKGDDATEHTIAVSEFSETIQPMAEEFMPLLTSPNGTKYKLTVSDDGTLSAVAVS